MEPFKNKISPELVGHIATHLDKHLECFDRASFEKTILSQLDALELKERSQCIADHMHEVLPTDLKHRNKILKAILHPHDDANGEQQSDEQGICGWGMFPLGMVVGQYGVDEFDDSLQLLQEMTKRFSSEFEIRYFLLEDHNRVLDILKTWVDHPSRHVRRLVSEGTRPRLPWAMQLPMFIEDPSIVLPLLKMLRDDPEEYVRRSVANHLNDIAKDHPDFIADLAKDWLKDGDKNRERLIKHACRTLIKQGHQPTLRALGYGEPRLDITSFTISTPQVDFGQHLEFEISMSSAMEKSQKLIIDYAIHHQRANGKTSPKVFKWKNITLEPQVDMTEKRKHVIKKISTRRYYAGTHHVEIFINGRSFGLQSFELQNV